jgi:TPR repeat protein
VDHPLILLALWLGCQEAPCGDAAACVASASALAAAGDGQGSIDALERACHTFHDADACATAGARWLAGRGPKSEDVQPFGRGAGLLQQACELGRADACVTLAKRHLQGIGLPKDDGAAGKLFELACAAGHDESCVDQGLLTEAGRGRPKDLPAALALYDRACAAGVGRGCVKVGLLRRAAGDGPGGVAKLEEGCKKGFYAGCGLAALAWEKGEGVTPDPKRRLAMLASGAALGDPKAIAALPGLEGAVEAMAAMDADLARRCREGEGGACLARASLADIDGEHDAARVAGLLHDACAAGADIACGTLAERADAGLAAFPDVGLVVSHERACAADRAASCEWLGVAYENGELTEGPDLRRAREVWDQACRLGRPAACDAVHRLDAPLP